MISPEMVLALAAAIQDKCFTTKTKQNEDSRGWIIDSGCTRHMTGNKEFLEQAIRCRDKVTLADGRNVDVNVSGNGRFIGVGEDGRQTDVRLKEVLYVPEMKANILSVSRMLDEGLTVCFSSGICRILRGNDVVLIGERRGSLFIVKQP